MTFTMRYVGSRVERIKWVASQTEFERISNWATWMQTYMRCVLTTNHPSWSRWGWMRQKDESKPLYVTKTIKHIKSGCAYTLARQRNNQQWAKSCHADQMYLALLGHPLKLCFCQTTRKIIFGLNRVAVSALELKLPRIVTKSWSGSNGPPPGLQICVFRFLFF